VQLPANNLVRLPGEVILRGGSLPAGRLWHGLAHDGHHRPSEGRGEGADPGASGGVGTCCVQLAKLAGAEVIVCASSAEKLARLKDLGADHGIDYSKEDFVKWVYARYGKATSAQFR